jgi:hypothetical protein
MLHSVDIESSHIPVPRRFDLPIYEEEWYKEVIACYTFSSVCTCSIYCIVMMTDEILSSNPDN